MARILIIEDEPQIRRLLRLSFEAAGHRVSEGGTGEEGLALASGVDLVVLDVMLPKMSGIEVFERLRKAAGTKDIPVIVLTASDRAQDTLRWDVGMENVFAKPFDPEALVVRATEILERRSPE